MKVFFTASQRGRKFFDRNFQEIFKFLEKHDYKNLDDTLVNVPVRDFYEQLERGPEADIKLFEKNNKCIQSADIVIFECSIPSSSIGFMIRKSIEANKPTIILYTADNIPYFLSGMEEEKLVLKKYNEQNLEKTLAEALEEAKNKSDKRFNFFITPSLLTYLNEASRKMGITKSTFIRNLILEHRAREK